MICRGPLRAKRDDADRLAARENVEFVWDSEVSEILGDNGVSGVRVRNVKTGANSELECAGIRSEEHTSELQSLMRNSYAVFCLKKKKANYKVQILKHSKQKEQT